jgi:hypothetical protein
VVEAVVNEQHLQREQFQRVEWLLHSQKQRQDGFESHFLRMEGQLGQLGELLQRLQTTEPKSEVPPASQAPFSMPTAAPPAVEATPVVDHQLIKSDRVRLAQVRAFDGNDKNDFRRFLVDLEIYYRYYGVSSEEVKITILCSRLEGVAAQWKTDKFTQHSNSDLFHKWNTFLVIFSERFEDKAAQDRADEELRTIKQRNVPIQEHLDKFNDIKSRSNRFSESCIHDLLGSLNKFYREKIEVDAIREPSLKTDVALLSTRLLQYGGIQDRLGHVSERGDRPSFILPSGQGSFESTMPPEDSEVVPMDLGVMMKAGTDPAGWSKYIQFCMKERICMKCLGKGHIASTCPADNSGVAAAQGNKINLKFYTVCNLVLAPEESAIKARLSFPSFSLDALVDTGAQGDLYLSQGMAEKNKMRMVKLAKPILLRGFDQSNVEMVEFRTELLTFQIPEQTGTVYLS